MKMSKLKLLKLFFIFLFTICFDISFVNAGIKTETYNNYYFFVRPVSKDDINLGTGFQNVAMYSGFESGNISYDPSPGRIIDLENSEDGWDYRKFYDVYANIIDGVTNTMSIHIGDFSAQLKYIDEIDGSSTENRMIYNRYFAHGVWADSSSSSGWNASLVDLNYRYGNICNLVCSSIPMNANVEFSETNNNYVKAIISRNFSSAFDYNNKIDWVNFNSYNVNGSVSSCNCSDDKIEALLWRNESGGESVSVMSPVLYKYVYTITTYECDPDLNVSGGSCNSSDTVIESDCERETITTSDGSYADINISQTGTISNILTPDSVYQGGGVKLGFTYYNTIKWDFVTDVHGNRNSLVSAVKTKLMSNNQFIANIGISGNILLNGVQKYTFSGLGIQMQKSCTRTGTFNEGEIVTTVCTFLLPESVLSAYTGLVTYKNARGLGINNKYYTPINFNGELSFEISLNNLNVLKNTESWVGNWSVTFGDEEDEVDSCSVDVYSRLYNPNSDEAYTFAFIYRPVDIGVDKVFPNRYAGVNWYEWYSEDINKERMANSYNNLNYSITLDNLKISQIKQYNKNSNGYLSFEGIDEYGKSDFVHTYMEVGDSS